MDDADSEDERNSLIQKYRNFSFWGDLSIYNNANLFIQETDEKRIKHASNGAGDLSFEVKFYDNKPYDPSLDIKVFGADGSLEPDESEDVVPDCRKCDILGWYSRTFHRDSLNFKGKSLDNYLSLSA